MTVPPQSITAYGVLSRDISHEIEIKRSRFLCYLSRVASVDEAREFVELVRAEHRTARHHCTAHVLGPARMERHSNDDGEPSGTAGVPMLDALTRFQRPGTTAPDCSDIVAVVVRYFGGVLLGAGGLVHAYSDAVSETLHRASFHTRERMRHFSLAASHTDAGRWEHELRAAGVNIRGTDYESAGAKIQLAVSDTPQRITRLHEQIATLTAGVAQAVDTGTHWLG